jgi:hypothetical protein
MNILLYYPRLFVALFVRPAPRSLAGFHHWTMAQLFFLWNEPWHGHDDSIAAETIRRHWKSEKVESTGSAEIRRAAACAGILYLLFLFYWPFIALLVAIKRGKWRFLSYWNTLVTTLLLYVDWGVRYNPADSLTLTHLSLFTPNLYVAVKTGRRMPDQKHLMHKACRRHGIPTPRVFGPSDTLPASGTYIIKPVAGFGGKGIVFTSDPSPYLSEPGVIVQEVVRNVPELRCFWNTDTLGTIRMMTVRRGDQFELAGPSHIKIPVGDAATDNFSGENLFAMIDSTGRLYDLQTTRQRTPGISHHPTTGLAARNVVIPRYDECIALAQLAHERLAPHLPFFNSDVTITEQGPMLIEINRIPGQPALMFDETVALRFVKATAEAVERVASGRHATPKKISPQSVPPAGPRQTAAAPQPLQLVDV